MNSKKRVCDAELLWSAPELLRLNPIDWPPCGTQAGDIYSLGIIMQEVHMRDLPFAQDELLPLEGPLFAVLRRNSQPLFKL